MRLIVSLFAAVVLTGGLTVRVHAAPLFVQGFEVDTSGWNSGGDYGSVTRVASGTGGITSYAGGFHAVMTQSASGPYTTFGGYSSTFPQGGFTAQIAVYLDTNWAPGEGFDYSVAASNQAGNHLRDFIFHVSKDISTGNLLVGGSNNTNFDPRQDLENLNHYVVATTGWYILEHVFRDDNGVLAVDLNLRDALGNLLFTETRSTPADQMASVVGGNRYGWFTNIDIAGGIEVDVTLLADATAVPEPASLAVWSLVGAAGALCGWKRRRRPAA